MKKLRLLAVYAHPDDEAFGSGGTFAKYANNGVGVALISASRGEAGEIVSDSLKETVAPLGAIREAELRIAAEIEGVSDLRFLDCIDGAVASCPRDLAVGGIVRAIRELRPHVVITFGPEGIYGHPDHIAVHHFALAACDLAANPDAYSEQLREGVEPYAPQKVYFRVIPRKLMPQLAGTFEKIRRNLGLTGEQIESFFTAEEEVTTAIDVSAYLGVKKRAIAAHRSQVGDEPFAEDHAVEAADEMAVEHYRLRNRTRRPGEAYETDLFSGVTL